MPLWRQQFIELQLECQGVAVLRVLYEEDHQEGDDCRAGIDDELPRIAVVKDGSCNRPPDDDGGGHEEGPCSRPASCEVFEASFPNVVELGCSLVPTAEMGKFALISAPSRGARISAPSRGEAPI
jgi:hypothetical protein